MQSKIEWEEETGGVKDKNMRGIQKGSVGTTDRQRGEFEKGCEDWVERG